MDVTSSLDPASAEILEMGGVSPSDGYDSFLDKCLAELDCHSDAPMASASLAASQPSAMDGVFGATSAQMFADVPTSVTVQTPLKLNVPPLESSSSLQEQRHLAATMPTSHHSLPT